MTTPNECCYTIIAYKPDSSDYCRGCHMASYSSDLCYAYNLSYDDLLTTLADVLWRNRKLDTGEAGYDDIDIWRSTDQYNYVRLTHDSPDYEQLMCAANGRADVRIAQEAADLERKKQEEVAREKATQAQRERREFARLKAKFEPQ